ncbi:hypothetical protein B4168_3704 [Anoxybacillus flavithermus]|nr:hypothetical protein B4168_3704 [Anoxybacillus flavithermus]OAO88110.1 hypothetical protein GT23_0843 [Parageobacillus thermoglucosidasius]
MPLLFVFRSFGAFASDFSQRNPPVTATPLCLSMHKDMHKEERGRWK